ncbi:zinc ribbon domain-containing protein YjdM [Kingella kingae]|uniref:zinc ribbon domain-containing protein YjdM n=1 Tax=Kingella kingae TaxID=504 RepID=UPI0003FE31CC|nr:zinc ribbon domain-containing protein YjdM [Kingella kingae]MDK4545205.1 zinc ribbon domain-containing protein YjdM [Kingella kingae]MDK4566994.1 zinc ribbon domain-containing protein YjdM [Kingella kingae]MDK4589692.1 zinc ribbon domain-containing protein YjdM [Kingella kingae]MDK4628685.1 zinc ribbon domain-containing protein YjdM [Kingella kingae]MDK4636615.1 zinc ribbon domain-containing protein YjdM [Kingella kingae]
MNLPHCPQYQSDLTYHDGAQLVCPECAHEWQESDQTASEETVIVKDANGTPLADGDTVVLIKDLKVKGSSMVIKQGTKVKGIRLQDGDHDIGCKIDGTPMNLKSEFVKKA